MSAQMITGYGKFHTNDLDPSKPDRKLTPYVPIDFDGIRALVDYPQQVDKAQGQWLIPSTLHSRKKTDQEQRGEYWALWADIDQGTKEDPYIVGDDRHKSIDQIAGVLEWEIMGGGNFELYASISATETRHKCRILIPLSKPLVGADWTICQEVLNQKLQGAGITPDDANLSFNQVMYLPNRGAFYQKVSSRTGAAFEPLKAWRAEIGVCRRDMEVKEKSAAKRLADAVARRASLQYDGSPSPIKAFNDAYTVEEILERAGYERRGNRFKHPNSETGNYSATVRYGRVHTLSTSDLLHKLNCGGEGAHDAFSAFQVLLHDNNQNAAITDAGDNWLLVDGGISWNKAKRRAFMQEKERREAVEMMRHEPMAETSQEAPQIDSEPADKSDALPKAPDPVEALASNMVSLSALDDDPELLPHVIDKWLPKDEVTLLAGHGEAGKSYVSLVISVHVALGIDLGALKVNQCNVLFFSGEDGALVLRNRIRKICRAMDIDPARLNGKLFLLDASDLDPALHRAQREGQQLTTETFMLKTLAGLVKRINAGLVVIDNASDAYDDDEIKRAMVRRFIRTTRAQLARPGRAVLLLAHVNKATATGTAPGKEDYSGSTAWHNSVRSRLSLTKDGKDGLKIEHLKANYGEKAEPVRMGWHEGVPMASGSYNSAYAEAAAALVKAAEQERDTKDKNTLVKIIQDFDRRGERVTTSVHGGFTVYKLLKVHADFPKATGTDRLTALLREMEDSGDIYRVTRRTPDRKWKEVFTCSLLADEVAPNVAANEVLAIGVGGVCAE